MEHKLNDLRVSFEFDNPRHLRARFASWLVVLIIFLGIAAAALMLGGCATTGDHYQTPSASNWYAKQCSNAMDELGLCPYNRF